MSELKLRESASPGEAKTANVIARPPLIYLGAMSVAWLIHALWPVELFRAAPHDLSGKTIVVGAVILFVFAVRELKKARTPLQISQPTTTIVRRGPYRFSRNPIYLSLTLLQLGIAIWVNSLWFLVMLIPALLLMSFGVIAREEKYLTKQFGEEYLQYKAKIRRWI